MMQVLSNNYRTFYNVISDITPEELCDIIRNQWSSYQLEKISDDFTFNTQEASIKKTTLRRVTGKGLLKIVAYSNRVQKIKRSTIQLINTGIKFQLY